MRIAAYNVENLFRRIKAFNDADPQAHAEVLDAHAELNKLFELVVYSEADKARMLELMSLLGILTDDEGPFVWMRKIRGQLVRRPREAAPFIVAEGREEWVGWVELKTAPVDELAIKHTAQVIAAADPDVLALVEVENRPTLLEFHQYILTPLPDAVPFRSLMLIDGNDDRGIDVGLALKEGYRIESMLSHVDDRMANGALLFSRDAPEYVVSTPSGVKLAVLPNHFKSKFGGNDRSSQAKRRAQAEAVAGIYRRLLDGGMENVVVLGDLNDTPASAELAPLFAAGLRDVSEHPTFTEFEFRANTGDRGIGTFQTGADRNKIDFILLSPALWDRVQLGGMERQGVFTGSERWAVFPTLQFAHHGASDHHLIWVDIDL